MEKYTGANQAVLFHRFHMSAHESPAVDPASLAKDLESFGTMLLGREGCAATDAALRPFGDAWKERIKVIKV